MDIDSEYKILYGLVHYDNDMIQNMKN